MLGVATLDTGFTTRLQVLELLLLYGMQKMAVMR